MEPEVAQMFEAALPDDVRAVCWDRIRELDAETTAELDEVVTGSPDRELRDLEAGSMNEPRVAEILAVSSGVAHRRWLGRLTPP